MIGAVLKGCSATDTECPVFDSLGVMVLQRHNNIGTKVSEGSDIIMTTCIIKLFSFPRSLLHNFRCLRFDNSQLAYSGLHFATL